MDSYKTLTPQQKYLRRYIRKHFPRLSGYLFELGTHKSELSGSDLYHAAVVTGKRLHRAEREAIAEYRERKKEARLDGGIFMIADDWMRYKTRIQPDVITELFGVFGLPLPKDWADEMYLDVDPEDEELEDYDPTARLFSGRTCHEAVSVIEGVLDRLKDYPSKETFAA